ncbi:hypothetical protein [Actinotignum urinale]|uniref:hypothetical protein n=1 Tax=Actinotignum urinale TaxID=190146 RepID=UPI0003B63B33|nr:hypothetical protein [Actinotignum urinale]MDY5159635.1 hypothetical protein [Actinotignum urinale]
MANVKTHLNKILSAIYGKDVRAAIHDSIDAINTQVETTTKAEADRVKAESTRASAETARTNAESTRVSQEKTRSEQETNRRNMESSRVEAESKRGSAETSRAAAEKTRVEAENTRTSQETSRKTAETTRASAETARASAESLRASAEDVRTKAEAERVKAETARAEAEKHREFREDQRKQEEKKRDGAERVRRMTMSELEDKEATREKNETTRISAEQERKTFYATMQQGFSDKLQEVNHFMESHKPVEIDEFLTKRGVAADAKATGDALKMLLDNQKSGGLRFGEISAVKLHPAWTAPCDGFLHIYFNASDDVRNISLRLEITKETTLSNEDEGMRTLWAYSQKEGQSTQIAFVPVKKSYAYRCINPLGTTLKSYFYPLQVNLITPGTEPPTT